MEESVPIADEKVIKRYKKNRLKISLSEKEMKMLMRYCRIYKISQTVAIKRLLREALCKEMENFDDLTSPQNQLDLFSPVQTNIFD